MSFEKFYKRINDIANTQSEDSLFGVSIKEVCEGDAKTVYIFYAVDVELWCSIIQCFYDGEENNQEFSEVQVTGAVADNLHSLLFSYTLPKED